MIRKLFAVLLIVILVICNASAVFSEDSSGSGSDETVYAMLSGDGSVNYINVVDRYRENGFSSKYNYKKAESLELPVDLSFKYYLNGTGVTADKLAGSSGEIKISINAKQNNLCADTYKDKYMTQIQLPVNLDHAKIISSEGVSSVITGSTETLSYTILPGEDASFELVFDADEFEMDSIQIILADYVSDLSSQFGDLVDGIHTMGEKAGDMIEGTSELKDGMVKLSEGANKLDKAVGKLDSGAAGLSKGMDDYSSGMAQYKAGLADAAAGVDTSYEGFRQINAGTEPILNGYGDLADALRQLDAGHDNLAALAEKLQNSSDPEIQALCRGVIDEAGGLDQLSAGLAQANKGLEGFAEGLNNYAKGMETLNQGVSVLPAGFEKLQSGFKGLRTGVGDLAEGLGGLKKGTSDMYDSVSKLPENVQSLVDGQVKFRNGINDMESEVKDKLSPDNSTGPVSFADGHTEIKSLQFIMKTPEIKKGVGSDTTTETAVQKQSFMQMIWDRVKALF